MAALVDTSILIDHLRGRTEAGDLLRNEAAKGEPLFASVLSRVEIIEGMRPRERPRTMEMMEGLLWIEVNASIADRAGEFANRYSRSHPGVDIADFVIAATREELDVTIWTLNVRHFPMIKRLRPPY